MLVFGFFFLKFLFKKHIRHVVKMVLRPGRDASIIETDGPCHTESRSACYCMLRVRDSKCS